MAAALRASRLITLRLSGQRVEAAAQGDLPPSLSGYHRPTKMSASYYYNISKVLGTSHNTTLYLTMDSGFFTSSQRQEVLHYSTTLPTQELLTALPLPHSSPSPPSFRPYHCMRQDEDYVNLPRRELVPSSSSRRVVIGERCADHPMTLCCSDAVRVRLRVCEASTQRRKHDKKYK